MDINELKRLVALFKHDVETEQLEDAKIGREDPADYSVVDTFVEWVEEFHAD